MQTKQLTKHVAHVVTLFVTLIVLTACATKTTQIYATDNVACSAFEPITYSRHDTKETRRQIVGHNAAFTSICGQDEKGLD